MQKFFVGTMCSFELISGYDDLGGNDNEVTRQIILGCP